MNGGRGRIWDFGRAAFATTGMVLGVGNAKRASETSGRRNSESLLTLATRCAAAEADRTGSAASITRFPRLVRAWVYYCQKRRDPAEEDAAARFSAPKPNKFTERRSLATDVCRVFSLRMACQTDFGSGESQEGMSKMISLPAKTEGEGMSV